MDLAELFSHYGYLMLLVGSLGEGMPIMLFGGFAAHRGWLALVPWVILIGAIGNAVAQGAAAPKASQPDMQRPPRLSIVVLPFTNMSGEPQQEYFVDGVTESLTTDLSRIGGSFVIGRNTAFTYKGKAVDLKQIGRELNVRYVLEGSVQRRGNRMRVNVQLIDAETAIISGPSGSISRWLISSACRTKSSRGWRARSTPNWPPPRRDARNRPRPPTRWTSIFRVWLGSIRVRHLTMLRKRAAFSIGR
jgi:TolB-like protein